MSSIKFKLEASPTFKAKVSIPVPGGKAEKVEFTFRHRTRKEFLAWLSTIENKEDPDIVLDVASGWELEDPFDREHIEKMCENFMGSAKAVLDVYLAENAGARLGN